MKKTLLLSVVASTMIMAGGDIAPVEPVVEAPAAAAAWSTSGKAVLFYQTRDSGTVDLFDQTASSANVGLQLTATNSDVFAGIGAGVSLNGLGTLGLDEDVVATPMQKAGELNGAYFSEAYLTYATGNTSFKVGRQTLPKALSPFAFSEGWSVFPNTFNAALVVNSDIENTTLVGAFVRDHNSMAGSNGEMNEFASLNEDRGAYMLTAQNKSIDGVTLTGTWYYMADYTANDNANVLWGDAKFGVAGLNMAVQAGSVMNDDVAEETTAYGAKVSGNVADFALSLAYSSVNDGDVTVTNLAGIKTPLYTQAILNQGYIQGDSDTFLVKAGTKALGGSVGVYYNYSDLGDTLFTADDYSEFAATYKTKMGDNTTLFAAYVNSEEDGADSRNFVRFWARYNF